MCSLGQCWQGLLQLQRLTKRVFRGLLRRLALVVMCMICERNEGSTLTCSLHVYT